MHMDNEQKKLKQATSLVTRYSSDEDNSDKETRRQYRATMPPPKINRKLTSTPTITNISPRSQSVYVSPVVRHYTNTDSEDDSGATSATNTLNRSFSSAQNTNKNNRSYIRGQTSQNFISGYDRSINASLSKSRDQAATSNGHSDDLFSDYGLSSHYPRSTLSTSSRKYLPVILIPIFLFNVFHFYCSISASLHTNNHSITKSNTTPKRNICNRTQ